MSRNRKRIIAGIMAGVLTAGLVLPMSPVSLVKPGAATRTVKFTKKTYPIGKGYNVKLTVKNAGSKKAKFTLDKTSKTKVKVVKKTKNTITLKGKAVGRAVVKAKVGKKTIKATVNVKKKYIALSRKKLTMKAGKSYKISITGTQVVKWSSSNKKVLTVRKTSRFVAKIRAKKAGTAYVRAKVGKKVYKCKVRVKGKTSRITKDKYTKKTTPMTYEEAQKETKRQQTKDLAIYQAHVKSVDSLFQPSWTDIGGETHFGPVIDGNSSNFVANYDLYDFNTICHFSITTPRYTGFDGDDYYPGIQQTFEKAYTSFYLHLAKTSYKATIEFNGKVPTYNSPEWKPHTHVALNYNRYAMAVHIYDQNRNLIAYYYEICDRSKFQDWYCRVKAFRDPALDGDWTCKVLDTYVNTRPDWRDATSTPGYEEKRILIENEAGWMFWRDYVKKWFKQNGKCCGID